MMLSSPYPGPHHLSFPLDSLFQMEVLTLENLPLQSGLLQAVILSWKGPELVMKGLKYSKTICILTQISEWGEFQPRG
jgi:hypothetical protein